MTLSEHIQASGLNPDTVQKKWRRKQQGGLLSRSFSRDLEPTQAELSVVFGKSARTKADRAKSVSAPTLPDISTDMQTDTQTRTKSAPQTKARTLAPGRSAVLVCVMVVCAAVSLSNMYDISSQIKPNAVDALLITGLFSLAPFAMLYAGVSGWAGWITSGICIAYEVFCNASGIYRGLAGLGSGAPYEVWTAGGFVDTVARVTTLDHKPCALGISFGMAGIVAALFLISLIELKKK